MPSVNTNTPSLPHAGSSREASSESKAGTLSGDTSSPSSPRTPTSPTRRSGVQHRKRDFYSESSPIPSIQRFFKRGLYDVISSREEDEASQSEDGAGQASSDDDTDKNPHADKSDRAERQQRRTRRSKLVDDPITRQRVKVRDVGKHEYDTSVREMDEVYKGKAGGAEDEDDTKDKRHSSKTKADNVLRLPFPPGDPLPQSILKIHRAVTPLLILGAILILMPRVPSIVAVLYNAWLVWWLFRETRQYAEDARWDRERRRGHDAVTGNTNDAQKHSDKEGGGGVIESAEWLNALMDSLWGVMNPDIFSNVGQTLEDVMQASVPRFIHSVKVEDLAQGSTPIRLTGFRVLPDSATADLKRASHDDMHNKLKDEKSKLAPDLRKRGNEKDSDKGSQQGDDSRGDDNGDEAMENNDKAGVGGAYINLELSFVYRAKPTGHTVASKSRNAHLMIKFWVGLRKIATVPLPVLVEIRGMVGTIRARVQLTPDPPFFKNVTFCFMGLPRIGVDVIPLHVNTTNIPVLAGFVQSSMDAAMGEYCAPSSLTMDIGEILMGDNIKREVHALGVVLVYIHSATDLEKQDVRGSSDPYCTIQYSKSGKILYATRVALNDLSPRWEERHVIVVNPEAVDAREKISIGLWDSDRFSADDMLGRAEVDLQALVKRPGRMFRRKDTLIGLSQEMSKQGYIEWSVGYFAKTPNRRRLVDEASREREKKEASRVQQQDPDTVDRQDVDVGTDAPHEEEQIEKAEGTSKAASTGNGHDTQQTRNIEHGVAFEPPSPALPSGILSMQLHSISQLECVSTRRSKSDSDKRARDGAPGQDVDQVENQQDGATSPSAYFRIILNDETVFQSRTKTLSSNPFFNAGTERFIRDWRRTLVMFVIYDSRLREEDAILGVIPLKLTDIFTETSQVTTVFPIAGGVGRGHVRMSLLFRPVQGLSRRQEKLGWDIGTVQILNSPHASATATKDGDKQRSEDVIKSLSTATIRARTLAGKARISARKAKNPDQHDRSNLEWHLDDEHLPVRIPARRRYAAPFLIEFHGFGSLKVKRKVIAMSVIWLQDVPDDSVAEYCLPIWQPKDGQDFHRLRQNYHDYRAEDEAEKFGVEKVGELTFKLRFKSGVGHTHTRFDTSPDAKVVMDAWRACASVGLRSIGGDFTNMRSNTQGAPTDGDRSSSPALGDSAAWHGRHSDNDTVPTDDSSASEDSDDERQHKKDMKRAKGEQQPSNGHDPHSHNIDEDGDDDYDEDDDDEDDDNDNHKGSTSVLDKVRKWTEERRELHRQHRGIKQYKAARTASWMGHNVKEGGSRVLSSLAIQDRRVQSVETEL